MISIIIPTYNEEEYLPILLESIKKQEYEDYEIIVADNDSSDKTREIAESYNCILVEGGLPAVGRNNGAKIAKGDYLLFLDSDLKLTDEYLSKVLYEFKMERLGIAITQMLPLSEKVEDKLVHDLANKFMISVENIKPHGAGCYGIIAKKSLHDECGGFDETLTFGEDTDYIERLSEKEPFKVLRNAKIGVSTRRLEEEGIVKLIKQYGKSTVNDFKGIRTDADELDYGFEHGKEQMDKKRLDEISLNSLKLPAEPLEKINEIKDNYDTSIQKINSIRSQFKKNIKRNKKVIFYCVCGEGMGHAIRTGVIASKLKEKYDIHLFSSSRAYNYLSSKFENVHEIGGFNTVYINNKVSNHRTLINAIRTNPTNIKLGYEQLYKHAKQLNPDIILTDFEIYGSIVSNLLKIPMISIDNIHMITQAKIDYPKNHYTEMIKAKGVIKSYVVRPKFHILTSFFYPKIRPKKNAVIYPPVIREDIIKLQPTTEDHIIVYQTSKESVNLVKKLKSLENEKFIVYGFNIEKTDGNLHYKEFNEDQFYRDLSSAKAVICNGGFTFISEAIYLKKPIYSVPAIGNFEQTLNGFYVGKLGYGEYHEIMDAAKVRNFLNNLPKYRKRLDEVKNRNNDGIINEIIYRIEKYSPKN